MKDGDWHDHQGGERQRHFLRFIRHVCPEADPASVILFGQMMRASNSLMQAAERNLGHAGLTWAKFRLLMSLHRSEQHGEREGLQPSELSEQQGISRNTVSALISSLERDRLISRELHGTDRRRFLIRLTPEGRRLLKSHLSSQFKFVSGCFAGFSPEERKTLAEMLTRLNQSLGEHNK